MADRRFHALFLCTGNSARSLMAECALRRWGGHLFRVFSAGSHPQPAPHPLTLSLLESLHYDVSDLRSKSWNAFARTDSPPLDFVFTVCDRARGESCPVWPGQPMSGHWGVEDPAVYDGPEERRLRLFRTVYFELETRIRIFASLPFARLDRPSLQARIDALGKTAPGPGGTAPGSA